MPECGPDGSYRLELEGLAFVFKKGPRGEPLLEYALASIEKGYEGEALLKKILRYNFVFLKRDPQCVLSFDSDRKAVFFWRNLGNDSEELVVSGFEKIINNLDIINKVVHN